MTRDELKQRVSETIERHADEIVAVGEAIRRAVLMAEGVPGVPSIRDLPGTGGRAS